MSLFDVTVFANMSWLFLPALSLLKQSPFCFTFLFFCLKLPFCWERVVPQKQTKSPDSTGFEGSCGDQFLHT